MVQTMISLPLEQVEKILTTVLDTDQVQTMINTLLEATVRHASSGYVFNFGKHIGKTMNQVHQENPAYLIWLAKKLEDDTKNFQDVKELLKSYV